MEWFQFLIGKVKTRNTNLSIEVQNMFQFLIGKVKTVVSLGGVRRLHQVSIPHR